jgi:hypothetical protein
LVLRGEVSSAFCSVRPPGHHATRSAAMGFCFFNNVAVGIQHALQAHGLQRVALIDFDDGCWGYRDFDLATFLFRQLAVPDYPALRAALLAAGRDPQMKPINITVQYLAAGKSKPSFAQGRITRLGRRNANVTVEAWQDDRSRPIATAVMNILMV